MSTTKALIFISVILYFVPVLTAACCLIPRLRYLLFACMVYFTSNEYAIHLYPMPEWKGALRGYQFTGVTLFAVPLLLSMMVSFKYKVRFFPPGTFFFFLYYFAIILSGVNAVAVHPWGFEVCRMFWMYITFLATFNFLNNCRDLSFFFYIVCFILIILFLVGFNQKYRMGYYQIASTFPHQNSLSLYLELFGLPVLGVMMNERISKVLFLLTLCAFAGSVLLIIFTYSRGGLVVYFGGIAIVCALSILLNGFSPRRLTLLLIGLIVLLSIVGYALPRIIQRFTKAPEGSKNTRIELAIAARKMANDHRLGVGANNYHVHSAHYWNMVKKDPVETGGIVETIYLLVAAECGWWGLGCMLLWFFFYLFLTAFNMIYLRKMACSGISIGIFAALVCNYWHSTLEWSMKQSNNLAEQVIIYALIGVIFAHRKEIRAAYKRNKKKKELAMRSRRKNIQSLQPPPSPKQTEPLPPPSPEQTEPLPPPVPAPVVSDAAGQQTIECES